MKKQKEWFSAEELVGLPGMPDTVEGVLKMAEEQGWISRPKLSEKGRKLGRELGRRRR